MTTPHRTPASPRARHQAATPPIPHPWSAGKDLAEMAEPHDLPVSDDRRPPGRPAYMIVVDQLRGWQPAQPPSLTELLEPGHARTREPEPDLEAEP